MHSIKTPSRHCEGRPLHPASALCLALSREWFSLLAALYSPKFAGKCLYVCAHTCLYTHKQEPTLTQRIGWNRVHQKERSEHSDQVQASARQPLAYMSSQSPFSSMSFSPDTP